MATVMIQATGSVADLGAVVDDMAASGYYMPQASGMDPSTTVTFYGTSTGTGGGGVSPGLLPAQPRGPTISKLTSVHPKIRFH